MRRYLLPLASFWGDEESRSRVESVESSRVESVESSESVESVNWKLESGESARERECTER